MFPSSALLTLMVICWAAAAASAIAAACFSLRHEWQRPDERMRTRDSYRRKWEHLQRTGVLQVHVTVIEWFLVRATDWHGTIARLLTTTVFRSPRWFFLFVMPLWAFVALVFLWPWYVAVVSAAITVAMNWLAFVRYYDREHI